MDIIQRRVGETVRVGGEISVTVIKVDDHHVKLGISVPEGMPVRREEVLRQFSAALAPTPAPVAHAE